MAPHGAPAAASSGPALRELALPLLAGVSFGLFLVFIHRAGGSTVLWPLTAARATSMGVLAAIGGVDGDAPAAGALGARPHRVWPACSTPGGTRSSCSPPRPAAWTSPGVLSSLYPASTVLLACLLLGERLTRRQTAGALATLAAIVCVSW